MIASAHAHRYGNHVHPRHPLTPEHRRGTTALHAMLVGGGRANSPKSVTRPQKRDVAAWLHTSVLPAAPATYTQFVSTIRPCRRSCAPTSAIADERMFVHRLRRPCTRDTDQSRRSATAGTQYQLSA